MRTKSIGQKLSLATAATTLLTLGTVGSATAVSLYSITDVGSFSASDINDQGQIVGSHYLWNNGTLVDLGTLPGATSTQANAINNLGQVVGTSGDRLFVWENNTLTDLGQPSSCHPCLNLSAADINDNGQIIGNYRGIRGINYTPSSVYSAGFLRNKDGTTIEVSFLATIDVKAINNKGQVAATVVGHWGGSPWLWDTKNNTRTSRSFPIFLSSSVSDLNDQGQVVGTSLSIISSPLFNRLLNTAYLWDNSGFFNLGTLGGSRSSGNGINNSSQVVGDSETITGANHAFLWEKGTLFDLNTLIAPDSGWELLGASKINNKGQSIGTGTFQGQKRSFLLTPVSESVPEPTSVWGLLMFAVFSIGFRSWKLS